MKIKYFIVLSAFLISCSVQKDKVREDWINLFKDYAAYRCACEITDNKLEPLLWSKSDISFSVNKEILGRYTEEADSIGRLYAKSLEPIAVDPESDLYGRKELFTGCLKFYRSNYLDSLANLSYIDYKNH